MIPPASIADALVVAADRFGAAEAVVDGTDRLSFTELLDRSETVARALIASGLAPGDRVSIWAPNSAAWIVASFGVYAAGGVLVPINTRFRGDEAAHILNTSAARFLLTVSDFLDADYLAMLREVPAIESLQEIVLLSGDAPTDATVWSTFIDRADAVALAEVDARRAAIDGDQLSDLIFTSGTTGAPKGAMLTHSASIRTYIEWSALVDLREGDRYLVVYPFFHTAGLKSGVLACVLRGATILPQAVFDVPKLAALVAAERITLLPGPPTIFQSIIDHPQRPEFDLRTVRSAVTGAAVVPVEVIRQMREVLGIRTVVTGYGMTETTGTISMCRFDDPPEVIARTVGRPIDGVEVRIADDDGHDVAQGTSGEILVRGFNVMLGYFGDERATTEAIEDGWLHTGDIGHIDVEGNLLITDRKKDMFIVGGFNAYPAEIEKIMVEHPDIAQVAVIGRHDDRLGEVGVAFVVPASGHQLDPDAVIAWCRENMANYKVPRAVIPVDALPLNPSGKVMKFVLRDLLTDTEVDS